MKPNSWEMFKIWLFGHSKTNKTLQKEGWKSAMPLYWVYCEDHGYMTTTVSGGRSLYCPACDYRRKCSKC